MPERICAIEGCDRPSAKRRLWCSPHYYRQWKYGDPLAPLRRGPTMNFARRAARARWRNMIRRCTNPADPGWKNYGGRGVTVCPGWLDFEAYYRDVGDCPAAGLSLDRIDNDGPYAPWNVRWATRLVQRHNRRPNPSAAVTHCPRDHEYTEANTYVYRGCRTCRTCRREKAREVRAAQGSAP